MERWGLNNMYVVPEMAGNGLDGKGLGYDRWFQLHTFTEAQTRDKNHGWWLENQKNVPIVYMQKKYPNVPRCVEFPLHPICELGRGYLTNSISYMIGLALLESIMDAPPDVREKYGNRWVKSPTAFEDVYLYGIDMATHEGGVGHTEGEFSYQRPSVEYWVGLLEGFGIRVHIPIQSDILKCVRLYGYEGALTINEKMKNRYAELSSTKMQLQQQLNELNRRMLITEGSQYELIYWDRNWVMDTDDEWAKVDEQGNIVKEES